MVIFEKDLLGDRYESKNARIRWSGPNSPALGNEPLREVNYEEALDFVVDSFNGSICLCG